MKTEYLKAFVDHILDEKLNVFGVTIRQHGEIIDETDIGEPRGRIQLFSASKTWTAMAIGIAQGEGLLKITDRLVDVMKGEYPETLPEKFDRVTIKNLLTMSTGHESCPAMRVNMRSRAEGAAAGEQRVPVDEWYDQFWIDPLVYDPEEAHFVYNNAATYILSCVITKLTGLSLRDYLMPRVFTPLGIEDPHWDTDSRGRSLGAIGLYLNTEELSRGGQLLLNGGKWNGVQLIPEEYVKEMGAFQVRNDYPEQEDPEARAGYGYQIWLCTYPGAYRMDGLGAKFSIQLPDLDAVIAITSHEMEKGSDILRAAWDTIVPGLKANLNRKDS